MHKNEVRPLPVSYINIQNGSKTKYRVKTIKLLREELEEKPPDIGFCNDFLHMTPKAQATTEKKNYTSSKLEAFVYERPS